MPPRKRRRVESTARRSAAATVVPSPSSPEWRLPPDILLEITARSDTATLIRFAAACKALRREILHQDFILRVCDERHGIVPSTLMLCLLDANTFHLLHPSTPATVSLAADHLAPFLSRTAATGLLEEYRPVTSRGGLILLERNRSIVSSENQSDLCVYDPMTSTRAFLPSPSDVTSTTGYNHRDRYLDHLVKFVLLTAADDIGCTFSVIAVDIMSCHDDRFPGRDNRVPIRVQSLSSDNGSGKWSPLATVPNPSPPGSIPLNQDNAAVVVGGVVHWLMLLSNHHILTYTISTKKAGLIRLPVDGLPVNWCPSESCLGSTPDGKLCLFTVDGLRVSIWKMSTSPAAGGGWTRRAVVDMWGTLRLMPIPIKEMGEHWIELESSGDQRTGAVLMRVHGPCSGPRKELVALDTETMRTRRVGEISGIPFEVNLRSRVTAMRAV